MDKPRRVEVFRYRPEPLHFLGFHYRDRIEDADLLMRPSGDYIFDFRCQAVGAGRIASGAESLGVLRNRAGPVDSSRSERTPHSTVTCE